MLIHLCVRPTYSDLMLVYDVLCQHHIHHRIYIYTHLLRVLLSIQLLSLGCMLPYDHVLDFELYDNNTVFTLS